MIPLLYDKTGSIKLGELSNCIECLVEEERNGLFEVSLIYPTNDTLFNSLEEENIIVCNANDTLLNQKFRIYMTRKLMSNRIEVFARHISFDLAYDYINNIDIENQSCEYALNTIFRNSQFSTHYRGYSDIINAQNYKISKVNCIEAIGGIEGSIIDTFGTGAEILRDNTNIHVLNKRGYDNGVSIEYAKNLTGFELEEDYSELITRIIPFASYTDNGSNEEILIEANAVDSDLISNYSHPYINYMDFSDKFEDEEVPTTSKLQELAKKYFEENNCDKPKQNYKIEFIPLSKCVGYEAIQDNISLCDTVTIKDTRYNINTQAKVIKTVFNVLKNKYESMELGEPKTTLGDIINSSSGGQDGEQGPPGPQGPPGADGNIGDFPNSLPSTPVLSANVYGFASIELNWTYENKVYYNYELYGSKIKDFIPNTFDLIHAGKTSSYLFQAKSNETWYFKVCAINTHGERTSFSDQITVNTTKVDDMSNYFESVAIGNAVVGVLTSDYMEAGIIKGNYIDAKNLSVTDGNGKRTLDIDSFGNVNLDATGLKISNKNIEDIYTTKSELTQTSNSLIASFSSSGAYNLLINGGFKLNSNYWYDWSNGNPILRIVAPSRTSGFCAKVPSPSSGMYGEFVELQHGGVYTYSASIKSSVNINMSNYYPLDYVINTDKGLTHDVNLYEILNVSHSVVNANNWVQVYITFKVLYNTNSKVYFQPWVRNETNNELLVADIMLAQGDMPKPWSPNPSEIYDGITRIDKDGIVVTQSNINGYTKMDASGFTVNNGSTNALTINANGLTMAGSLFANNILHTKGGIYTYESIRGQGDNFAVVGSNGYTVVRSDKGDVYLQPAEGKEVKVTSAVNASNYQLMRVGKLTSQGDVYAYGKMYTEGGTIVTSDRDRKKNIKPYKVSALKEICDTTIYNYHLDTDLDEELQRIGVIMQEAPMDIVDISGKGVDLYQMVTMSWKAIQELKEENNNLKLELEEFKKVVK
mgnify:CR=1 FL=1